MSEYSVEFKEFIHGLKEPDNQLMRFIGQLLSSEMTSQAKSTKNILRYASDLKREYRDLGHYAIAKNLRYEAKGMTNSGNVVKAVYNQIRDEEGPVLHLCMTMQNYAQEMIKHPETANNRYGYGIKIKHTLPKTKYPELHPKSWDRQYTPGRDNLSDFLNTIRMKISTLLHQVYALDKKSPMAICIREAITRFDKFIIQTESGLEFIRYEVELRDPSEPEQIIVLATQGCNEVLGGYSIN
jgi:hypothetical protein